MGVSYNRLWKMLIDKNMKRIEMQYLTEISGNILARMGKNQYVSMEMIEKTEITFMQTRLIRLASEELHLPVEQMF